MARGEPTRLDDRLHTASRHPAAAHAQAATAELNGSVLEPSMEQDRSN